MGKTFKCNILDISLCISFIICFGYSKAHVVDTHETVLLGVHNMCWKTDF